MQLNFWLAKNSIKISHNISLFSYSLDEEFQHTYSQTLYWINFGDLSVLISAVLSDESQRTSPIYTLVPWRQYARLQERESSGLFAVKGPLACGMPAVYFCLKTQVQKNPKKRKSSTVSLHLGCFNTMAGKAQVRMESAESGVSRTMELGSLAPTQRWTINCRDCALLFEHRLQSWTVSWTLPLVLRHRLDSGPLFSCKNCLALLLILAYRSIKAEPPVPPTNTTGVVVS